MKNASIAVIGLGSEPANEIDRAEIELRKECRAWTPEQWESYLETLEAPLREVQVNPWKYDRIKEEADHTVFDLAQKHSSPALIARVQSALEELTTRQRQVVEMIFFKSKSTWEVAEALGLSQSSVTYYKRKSLKKLRRALEGDHSFFLLVEGPLTQLKPKRD